MNAASLPDYLNNKLVLWSLRALQLATSLLSLFGKEAVKWLAAVVWPLLSWPFSYYQLGKEIAHRVQAVLEFTASDGGKSGGPGRTRRLTERAYRDAPEPVRKYLRYALGESQPDLKCVCIKQSGYFRFLPTTDSGAGAVDAGGQQGQQGDAEGAKAWKKLTGEAWVSIARPGLVWSATIQLSPFTWVRGFAAYLRGRGSTHWKLCSLFRVDDIEGERSLDTLALLRFLAEAPCYPMALLPSDYLRWEPIDSSSARAIITDGGLRASAVFRFNAVGQVVSMRTTHSARSVGSALSSPASYLSRDPYRCYYRGYARMGGRHALRIPTEVEAAWELPGGEYSYAQLEIRELVCWDTMEMPHHQD